MLSFNDGLIVYLEPNESMDILDYQNSALIRDSGPEEVMKDSGRRRKKEPFED